MPLERADEFVFPSRWRITQLSDEGLQPSFFSRFRDPVDCLTKNWNYIRSADFDLANRLVRDADVVIVQRAYSDESRWLTEAAKRAGTAVIYETDDLLLDLPPLSGLTISSTQKKNIIAMVSTADAVTCSSVALAKRLSAYHANVKVLENYAVPFPLGDVWPARSGSPHVAVTSTDCLRQAESRQRLMIALRQAIQTLHYRVTFLGSADPSITQLQRDYPERVEIAQPVSSWRKVFLADLLQRGVNVALVPREKSMHGSASDMDFQNFASIGVPVIFHEESGSQAVHGCNGFLCNGAETGWLEGLTYLADESTRNRCGEAAYRTAGERTVHTYARELAGTITTLLGTARSASA